MSARMPLIYAYPDCPTCDKQVDEVEHESLNDRREFSADYTIHAKGNPFVLRPCGHEMHGLVLQFDPVVRITEWQVRNWPPLPWSDGQETSPIGEIVHLIADGEAVTSCCGRTPFELPRIDRITTDPKLGAGCG